MTLYELIETPQLEDPVLVLALEGWIDAGLAAAGVARVLEERLDTVTIARFSTDELLDYRARRPIAHLVDGVLRGLTWPSIELRAAVDDAGNELLVLAGAEPDRLWHRFTDEVVGLALDHGVRMCVGLGAYPYAAPHTRAPRVACTASTPRLAEGANLLRGTLDFPGGIQAAIEQACHDRGIPSIGLWAQIPHYLPAQMPFPAGSLALVEAVNQVAELSLPTGDLAARAEATRARLDELIAQNPEHVAMLRQLEAAWDQAVVDERTVGLSDLPTGDELAAELEDFLRRQRPE
jgi:predicted ATP-grasp superfamily ATP-dependent carboligase